MNENYLECVGVQQVLRHRVEEIMSYSREEK